MWRLAVIAHHCVNFLHQRVLSDVQPSSILGSLVSLITVNNLVRLYVNLLTPLDIDDEHGS